MDSTTPWVTVCTDSLGGSYCSLRADTLGGKTCGGHRRRQ